MSKSNVDILVRLPLAALAIACGSALGAQINPDLAAAVRRDGSAQALIVLADQSTPMLAPFAVTADYKQHRRALVDALRARAETQQNAIRALLDSRGIAYHSYWIANVVLANVDSRTLSLIAARREVSSIEPNPSLPAHLPRPTTTDDAPAEVDSIAWGVSKINAPEVWAAGDNGQNVVIAGEDTGYQWDHPALKPHYRGWNGTTANHNYNWHDSIHDSTGNPCGNNSPAPCDDFGHGTHTAGTFAGDDGATHQIGVAPGAKWIGCRNMDDGNGTPARYIECMQWMLAPTDLNDQNPNPDLAPDVISNSWTCIPSEGCTVGNEIHGAVINLTTGGIFFVAAAANDGPNCSTITDPPAIYAPSFTIGATDISDTLASFSSRGPVISSPGASSKSVKPDVSAPGVNVPSSWPPNTYANLDGTSMATPHVAGAAALVMSANPALKGHPAAVANILRDTAVTVGITDPVNQTCGGTSRTTWPNNMIGHGRIDAFAAYQAALAGDGESQ
ncbi:MAG TPA: S8 family serine peptidase [Rhodanobacteraceae bacterium]|jgi:subtilisin family serine protease|nr:S8 family serine peptidase [Rhodanobacteraceae bacterium]